MDKQREPEPVDPVWEPVRNCLENKKRRIFEEIRNYPPPIAGCDLHFKRLLEERDAISRELRRLDAVCRSDVQKNDVEAFLESSNYVDGQVKEKLRKELSASP